MDDLTFNGVSANSLNFFVKSHDLVFAEKDIELEEVPGKNGAIIHDYKKYKNVISPYTIGYYGNNLLSDINRVIDNWFSVRNYAILSDNYDTKIRYGILTGQLEFTQNMMKYGEATLNFDCKPLRYNSQSTGVLITQTSKSITYGGTEPALPIITISGNSGSTIKFSIGGVIYQLSNLPSGQYDVVIDSEKMAVYRLKNNVKTNFIKYCDFVEFPVIPVGTSSFYIYSITDRDYVQIDYREAFV